ncbi:MAG: tetratricopeptide repeat protein [Longibaculum muris]|uniref:tetratricopeptide repeat protein n=1 Tax=Longibaculum muris TaxID=1796628 RepID=UPI000794455F|nr:tetratricopeptide repeat protein [Longibaculum muris]KXU47695.1 hypothetical protein HMPREF3037_01815 [Candidatus Stoquefichus sp. KLE1796]MBS5368322.1 hypothetical protein [Coprobacillus cateniformis]MED9811627.1 tetratricopeptide repeat protein [Longibaculum muris]
MFNSLFKNKGNSIENLLEKVKTAETQDFNHMFKAYYQLGKAYLEKGDNERAMHYLSRADSLTMSIDDINASDKEMDEVSDFIGQLEDEDLLHLCMLQEVEEKSENLNYVQMSLWNLFTLCRLEKVLVSFGNNEDCEILTKIPDCIDLVFKILTEGINEEEIENAHELLNDLYDFSDSEAFYAPQNTISLPQLNEPLQLFDTTGSDAMNSLQIFIDHEINNFLETETSDDFAVDFVVAALGTLKSYYLRTQDGDITNIPQIQKEINNIREDYELLFNEPSLEDIESKMKQYRENGLF